MPPVSRPIGGISRSLVNDVTILPNAPPITTPTAMSTTLPRIAKSLNSAIIPICVSSGWCRRTLSETSFVPATKRCARSRWNTPESRLAEHRAQKVGGARGRIAADAVLLGRDQREQSVERLDGDIAVQVDGRVGEQRERAIARAQLFVGAIGARAAH